MRSTISSIFAYLANDRALRGGIIVGCRIVLENRDASRLDKLADRGLDGVGAPSFMRALSR
jgi:hypothetical protein